MDDIPLPAPPGLPSNLDMVVKCFSRIFSTSITDEFTRFSKSLNDYLTWLTQTVSELSGNITNLTTMVNGLSGRMDTLETLVTDLPMIQSM